jgi:hypothetical protein
MTILTHTLVTTVGVRYLHLSGNEALLAYIFGVVIDLDHFIKIPLYLKKHNFKIRDILQKPFPKEKQYNWRTSLQEPVALLWIIPLSIFLKTPVPVIFFALHLLLDYLMSYQKLPFYPFSGFKIKGFFIGIPDKLKEVFILLASSLCIIYSLL